MNKNLVEKILAGIEDKAARINVEVPNRSYFTRPGDIILDGDLMSIRLFKDKPTMPEARAFVSANDVVAIEVCPVFDEQEVVKYAKECVREKRMEHILSDKFSVGDDIRARLKDILLRLGDANHPLKPMIQRVMNADAAKVKADGELNESLNLVLMAVKNYEILKDGGNVCGLCGYAYKGKSCPSCIGEDKASDSAERAKIYVPKDKVVTKGEINHAEGKHRDGKEMEPGHLLSEDEVTAFLKIDSVQLRDLVRNDSLRAFSAAGKLKFRYDEVKQIKLAQGS